MLKRAFLGAALLFWTPAQADPALQTVITHGDRFSYSPAIIASGGSLSGIVDLGPANRLFAILQDPTAWTAAALTFQASTDGVNFYNLFDSTGAEVSWTVAAQQYQIEASPAKWQGVRYIKVRSGTSATPVAQAAQRSLVIVTVP